MMKELVYKEFRLNLNPWMYLWLAPGLLLFIPSWVFFVAIAYLFMFFMLLSQMDKANRDLGFAVSLPVPKSGIVIARTWTTVIIEVAGLSVAALVALARYWLYPAGNEIGMNTNLAFFGFMFVMFAVFNIIYLPGSYKRAYRMLWPIAGGSLVAVAVAGMGTSLVVLIPGLAPLNDRGLGHLAAQSMVFAGGVVVYAALTWLGRRKAVSLFAEADL